MSRRGFRWTADEEARLTMMWGVHPIATIAHELARTPDSVYHRAAHLRLGRGCPQGYETVNCAAARTGFDRDALVRLLRWANVRIWRAWSRHSWDGKGRVSPHHVVEPTDVDEAIARWGQTELVVSAARRLGIDPHVLERLVREAIARGDKRLPKTPRVRRKRWRVSTELLEDLVRDYRARIGHEGGEPLAVAARRVGRDKRTLQNALRAAGVRVGGRGVLLDPADVDRVAASMGRRPQRRGPGLAKARPRRAPTETNVEAA